MINHLAMDEAAIERVAERQMDRLDEKFLAGTLTRELYDIKVAELADWAKAEYRKARAR